MKLFFFILIHILFTVVAGLNTVSKEELKVASDNSRKLADELTRILDRLKVNLGQEHGYIIGLPRWIEFVLKHSCAFMAYADAPIHVGLRAHICAKFDIKCQVE